VCGESVGIDTLEMAKGGDAYRVECGRCGTIFRPARLARRKKEGTELKVQLQNDISAVPTLIGLAITALLQNEEE